MAVAHVAPPAHPARTAVIVQGDGIRPALVHDNALMPDYINVEMQPLPEEAFPLIIVPEHTKDKIRQRLLDSIEQSNRQYFNRAQCLEKNLRVVKGEILRDSHMEKIQPAFAKVLEPEAVAKLHSTQLGMVLPLLKTAFSAPGTTVLEVDAAAKKKNLEKWITLQALHTAFMYSKAAEHMRSQFTIGLAALDRPSEICNMDRAHALLSLKKIAGQLTRATFQARLFNRHATEEIGFETLDQFASQEAYRLFEDPGQGYQQFQAAHGKKIDRFIFECLESQGYFAEVSAAIHLRCGAMYGGASLSQGAALVAANHAAIALVQLGKTCLTVQLGLVQVTAALGTSMASLRAVRALSRSLQDSRHAATLRAVAKKFDGTEAQG